MTTSTLDNVSNETEASEQVKRRAAFVQSLRDCATWLEQHPRVQAPRYIVMNVFPADRDELATQARAANWRKEYTDGWFNLVREFGLDLCIHVSIEREQVCRKVVVGTERVPATPEHEREIVEWVCDDSLLGAAERQPAEIVRLADAEARTDD